mmetsp:Transcript_57465/g.126183  ORF Transcript_57465/g.126183 Transcript_57465/m.126183 type:complete len:596 (+) Transcript_57465:95-1882(+)
MAGQRMGLGRGPWLFHIAAYALLPATLGFDLPDFFKQHVPHAADLPPDEDTIESPQCPPEDMGVHPGGWPVALDFGIYWFGPNGQFKKAQPSQQVRAMDPTSWFEHENRADQFYDPSRNTVIYFHGWSGADSWFPQTCERLSGTCGPEQCPNGGGQKLADPWLQAGWNVGFFYWDQFANEPCMRNAEQKIWFDRQGDGFRWKSFNVSTRAASYKVFKEDTVSVTDFCVNAVKLALGQYSGPHVRFVGHSIGAQLATRCAAMLHSENHQGAPHRMALLEPFFSKHHLYLFRCKRISTDSGIGDFTAAATAVYVKSLWEKHGVITEIFKSSVLTELSEFGVPNEDLERLATLVEYEPHWCGGLGPLSRADIGHLQCRHCAAFPLYFLAYGRPSPPILPRMPPNVSEPGSAASTCATPIASCGDDQVADWVKRQHHLDGKQKWTQAAGAETFDTGDDAFKLTPSLQFEAMLGASGRANDFVLRAPKLSAVVGSTVATSSSGEPWQAAVQHLRIAGPISRVPILSVVVVLSGVIGLSCIVSGVRGSDLGQRRYCTTGSGSDSDDDDTTVRSFILDNSRSDLEDIELLQTPKGGAGREAN